MGDTVVIERNGKKNSYPKGVTFQEIALATEQEEASEIILAYYNNKLHELSKKVREDGKLEFLTLENKDGMRAYRRSVIFLMQCALEQIQPDSNCDIAVKYSLGDGYFCQMEEAFEVTEEFLLELKTKMQELVKENISLQKKVMNTRRAEEMFRDKGMTSKEKLLRYRSSSNTNIYELDGCKDYFYGYMVPSTGYLKYFDLQKFEHGFVILFPIKNPTQIRPFDPSMKLFHILKESAAWSDMLDIPTVGALNDAISKGRTREIILMQEAFMEEKIGTLAKTIASKKDCKFIMIAGPSSSGKTTFSHRLSIQLEARGLHPHPFPLDDYYKNREEMPVDEFGEKDYEALEGLDIELFNQDMTKLLAGENVELPIFNFKVGKREYHDRFMQLGKDDVLVIEGIHGLNDSLSYSLPKESKYKIYISALTQLAIDEHNPLSTTDGRLIRRIVRDARTRGTSAQETIARWPSVRRGEEKNIFPFQEAADEIFNSALIYEMAALKLYATPQLYAISRECPEYMETKRLLKLLDYFLPIPTEDIGNNSLVREFIGGSCFKV